MDSARFDDLTRTLTGVRSRRDVVRGAAGALGAAFGLRLRGTGAAAGRARRPLCHATGDPRQPWMVIDVAEPAWNTHLAHGDGPFNGCCSDADCGGATPFCAGGTCVECRSVADCDDEIACTVDACVDGACRHTPDDALCSATNAPCEVSICADGRCRTGTCVPCRTDVCDPLAGGCTTVQQPDSTYCLFDPLGCFAGYCHEGVCIVGQGPTLCDGGGADVET